MVYAVLIVLVPLAALILAAVLAFATLTGTGCMEGRHDWWGGECVNCGLERT